METVTHDGRTTAYRRPSGREGAPTLYVHGAGATHQVWVNQYGRPDHPAVAVDLSGHGASEDVDARPEDALDAYADDVVAVARETGARALVGNSMGGAVALQVALERTHGFAGLVLSGTGARLPVHPDLLSWLDGEFERAVEFLHRPDYLFHDPDPGLTRRTVAALRDCGSAVTARDFRACDGFDARGRLDGVDVPALAVCGAHDSLTPPEYHEYLADHIPDCEYVEVGGTAHLPMLERPAAFDGAVDGFLERL